MKDLNNIVEADHGKLKQLIRLVHGFNTIKGFEVMRALRKGQAGTPVLQGNFVGEPRFVECALGLGRCAWADTMAWLQDRLASAET